MIAEFSDLQVIRNSICHRFQICASVVAIPALALSCYRAVTIGWQPVMYLYIVLAMLVLATTAFRQRLSLPIKGGFIIMLMVTVGVGGMLQFGLLAAGTMYLVSAPLLAALLFGGGRSIMVLAGIVVSMAAIAGQVLSTGSVPQFDLAAYMASPIAWIHEITSLLFVAGTMVFMFQGYSNSMIKALSLARRHEETSRDALTKRLTAEGNAAQAQKVALVVLADLAEHRDSDTGDHVLRVARMAHEIARTLLRKGIEPDTCNDAFLEHIGLASILHDVGKVSIPDAVLLKPGKLTPEERAVMERHAHSGGDILSKAERMLPSSLHFKLARQIAADHHEHWNGLGYPRRLHEREIPLAARIVAVSDVYDALVAKRPYKEPWPADQAAAFIRDRSGSQFDPAVVEAFFDVLAMREKSTVVEWSDAIAMNIPMVDHDHRILLELINQIANSENANDPTAVKFVLDELVNYTNFHFKREEDVLAEVGYPDLDEHRQLHSEMIAEVIDLQRRFDDRNDSVGGELSQFLAMWLVNHIMYEDRRYRPFVVNQSPRI